MVTSSFSSFHSLPFFLGFDFFFVDLFKRSSYSATPSSLMHDPYIFKPVPLVHRSWVYQSMFEVERKASEEYNDR